MAPTARKKKTVLAVSYTPTANLTLLPAKQESQEAENQTSAFPPSATPIESLIPASPELRCKHQNPYDGYPCTFAAWPGDPFGRCIFHCDRIDKDADLLIEAMRRKADAGDYFFDGYFFPMPMDFREIDFRGSVSFRNALFHQGATFAGCKFGGKRVVFSQCRFGGIGADFSDCVFQGEELLFDGVNFGGQRTLFRRSRFQSDRVTFETSLMHSDEINFSQAGFGSENTSFAQADMDSNWILFEGIRQDAGMLSFRQAALRGKMISFEEFEQRGGVFSLHGAHLRGRTLSFSGAVLEGQSFNADCCRMDVETIRWEHIRWAPQASTGFRSTTIHAQQLSFAHCTAPLLPLDLQNSQIQAEQFTAEKSSWGGGGLFQDGRWKIGATDFQSTRFHGDEFRFDRLHLDGERFNLHGLKSRCRITSMSNARITVKECNWTGCEIESNIIQFEGMEWTGQHYRMDRTICRAEKILFDRSRFSGDHLTFEQARFFAGMVSFLDAHLLTTIVQTDHWLISPGKLQLGAHLGHFRFKYLKADRIDFTNSRWPLTSIIGRPICQDEYEAATHEDLEWVAKFYQRVAEYYTPGTGPHSPRDFLNAALDCGRLHVRWFSEPWLRLRLEWFRLATTYGTKPWKSIVIWCGLAFLSLLYTAWIGSGRAVVLWPLSFGQIPDTFHYLTSWENAHFPKSAVSLHPASLWENGFLTFLWGILTSAVGYGAIHTITHPQKSNS